MVIWPAFCMGQYYSQYYRQYRVNDHPYHAPQFKLLSEFISDLVFQKDCILLTAPNVMLVDYSTNWNACGFDVYILLNEGQLIPRSDLSPICRGLWSLKYAQISTYLRAAIVRQSMNLTGQFNTWYTRAYFRYFFKTYRFQGRLAQLVRASC